MKNSSNNQDVRYLIYEEELEELAYKPSNVISKALFKFTRIFAPRTDLDYSLSVPVSDYLRGELFCDDVSEAMEETFSQTDLINLLLADFLYQAKRRSNPYDLYHYLASREKPSIQIYSYNGENKVQSGKRVRRKKMTCSIKRKDALRLEVMLSDIADLDQDKAFTVNEVLLILYSDFIQKYKNGSLTNVLERIIGRL
ncbi:hypothetical protein ABES38_08805 [Bacillus gobiensis]|uniref:hypothetical protein n=1 Tax=Bacillus gobiensis TaxID=1441095 RepID=UPI003D1C5A82